jgi:hypothetical protein
VYIWKAVESLPFIDYAVLTDALIVDPVEALMGISTFIVLEEFGYAKIAFPFPWKKSNLYIWLKTGYSWVPLITTVILIDVFNDFDKDWIYIITFLLQAIHTAYFQDTTAQQIIVILYPLTLSVLIVTLNRIPYNGWYTSLWYHIFLVPLLFMYVFKNIREWWYERSTYQIPKRLNTMIEHPMSRLQLVMPSIKI